MPLVVGLGATLLGMTSGEALTAATAGGAQGLRRPDLGRLEVGAAADLVAWDAEHEGAFALHARSRSAAADLDRRCGGAALRTADVGADMGPCIVRTQPELALQRGSGDLSLTRVPEAAARRSSGGRLRDTSSGSHRKHASGAVPATHRQSVGWPRRRGIADRAPAAYHCHHGSLRHRHHRGRCRRGGSRPLRPLAGCLGRHRRPRPLRRLVPVLGVHALEGAAPRRIGPSWWGRLPVEKGVRLSRLHDQP